MITRALGSVPGTRPDLYEINVEAGDRLLLCSDGLTTMLHDDEIETILARSHDPQRAAAQLVNEAIAAGGFDNVTVIVTDVAGRAEEHRKKASRKIKRNVAIVIALFIAIVAGAAYGFNYWVSNAAYLGVDGDRVAIYRGVPGSIFGFSSSTLEETTDVAVDDLNPGLASRLREEGVSIDGIDAARDLVNQYREDIERDAEAEAETAEAGTAAASEGEPAADGESDTSAPTDDEAATAAPDEEAAR